MKTDLFYCTGTGNSLWIARELARGLGDAQITRMSQPPGEIIGRAADAVGIIFPAHIWGLPHWVIDFVDALEKNPSRYHFAVAVNAGQVAATLLQLKRLMHAKGISLSFVFEIAMPSNYIYLCSTHREFFRYTRQRFCVLVERFTQMLAEWTRI